jgi:hypothetical protein
MIIGPDEILRCPSCYALMRGRTFHSYSTWRARLWSDGYVENDASLPEWTLCPGCKQGLYVRDLEVVGNGPDEYRLHRAGMERMFALRDVRAALKRNSWLTRLRRRFGKLPSVDELKAYEAELEAEVIDTDPDAYPGSEDIPRIAQMGSMDYERLLADGLHGGDTDKEIGLRRAYWWTMNNPLRKDPALRAEPLEAHRLNLQRLEELLLKDGSPDVSIVALRMEMGRFEEAMDNLATLPVNVQTQEQRDAFTAAIQQRVDRVFRII